MNIEEILKNSYGDSLLSTNVEKETDVHVDVGGLAVFEPVKIDLQRLKDEGNAFLQSAARENVQLLVNKLWDCPTSVIENATAFDLPASKMVLPREKPIPTPRLPTKWEEYARLKGIPNKKKSRMVYDDKSQEYKPRWGYKRIDDLRDDWLLEIPQNADPFEDQFAKKKEAKKERVAKNELQRLRNLSRNMKGKMPGIGITPTDKPPEKDHVSRALAAARKSDASIGKFSTSLPQEEKKVAKSGKKRKFETNTGDFKSEKKRALDVLDKVMNRAPVVNVNKAANLHIDSENRKRSDKQAGGRRSKQGGKKSKKSSFMPKKKGGKKGGKQFKPGKKKGRKG